MDKITELEKENIKIKGENVKLKQGIDELKKELEFKKNRKFQEKCILIARVLLGEEPVVEYRPSFMEGLELDAFFRSNRIALEVQGAQHRLHNTSWYKDIKKLEDIFEGWEAALDPDSLSLLSFLSYRKTKDDFTYDRQIEHLSISKIGRSWAIMPKQPPKWPDYVSGWDWLQAKREDVKMFWARIEFEQAGMQLRHAEAQFALNQTLTGNKANDILNEMKLDFISSQKNNNGKRLSESTIDDNIMVSVSSANKKVKTTNSTSEDDGDKSPTKSNLEENDAQLIEEITQELNAEIAQERQYNLRERKEINYAEISGSDIDPYHVIILVTFLHNKKYPILIIFLYFVGNRRGKFIWEDRKASQNEKQIDHRQIDNPKTGGDFSNGLRRN
ncbi:4990_t:CDS:2 [Diversispora eburnea]|uniref:4990_t:CDS:1 n=1 Tax=Diversispora eburnea TaxID=1213867 RepID=A0A9N9BWH3_9GLOM|nr:4990_t:CDS:2 [Diversispora eburnea]